MTALLSAEEERDGFERLERWQGHILQINHDLLLAPADTLDETITDVLSRIGRLTDADRTYAFQIFDDGSLNNTHEWVAPGIQPMIEMLQNLPADMLDPWEKGFERNGYVHIPAVSDLPEGDTIREILEAQDIRSLLSLPLYQRSALTGFIGCDAVRKHRVYTEAEMQLLESVARTISFALAHRAAERRATNALAEVERQRDKLAGLVSALPDLMLETDSDGRFINYHFGFETTPMIPPEVFMNTLLEESLPPHLATAARQMMQDLQHADRTPTFTYPMLSEGETRWFNVSAGRKKTKDGDSGFVFLVRDITALQESLIESRRLGQLARLTTNPVVVTDVNRRITWVNPAFENLTGWSQAELVGRKDTEILRAQSSGGQSFGLLDDAFAQKSHVRKELPYLARSGEIYWASSDIQPLFDTEGVLEGYLTVQTDITRIMQEHKAVSDLLLAAINASTDAITILNPQGRCIYLNPALRELFGIPSDSPMQQLDWQSLLAPASNALMRAEGYTGLLTHRRWNGELQGVRADGAVFDMDVSLSLTPRDELVCVMRDVTRRKQADMERSELRDQLQKAERREALAQVASAVAHDLNNLVAVVAGSVALLENNHSLDAGALGDLQRMRRATVAIEELVTRLGKLERRDSLHEDLDLHELMAEVVDLMQAKIQQRCRIKTRFPERADIVSANRTELLQVLFNLVLNACEADDLKSTHVTLAILAPDDPLPRREPDVGMREAGVPYVAFQVADAGTGVPPELMPRLFDRYVTTKGDAGTGLGLPIVASIVRDNRAALWFDTTLGKGSTVTVAWPAKDESTTGAAQDMPLPKSSQLAASRVLVVDDNVDFAEILGGILEAEGAVAIALSNPQEAIDLVRTDPGLWSVIVTDYDMPRVTGVQLAKAVQRIDPHLPCILVSALPGLSANELSVFHSAFGKPVQQGAFLQSVREAIWQRQSQG